MEFYGDEQGFIDYHAARGKEPPATAESADIEAALRVASEWLDGTFGEGFSGWKTGGFTQARMWPRTSAFASSYPIHYFDNNEIPERVTHAVYEAALKQLENPGSLMVDHTPGKYNQVSVSGVVSVQYREFFSTHDRQTQFRAVDLLLAPLLNSNIHMISDYSSGSVRA